MTFETGICDEHACARKCARQIIINKPPHECGLSRHPAPCMQPKRAPFGYGGLVGNAFKHRSSRTAQVYLACCLFFSRTLEHAKNNHGAHTTYTTIQLRVYYRTVPDMQHPAPTHANIALPECKCLSRHKTPKYEPIPQHTDMTEPPHTDHTRETWPTSIELTIQNYYGNITVL